MVEPTTVQRTLGGTMSNLAQVRALVDQVAGERAGSDDIELLKLAVNEAFANIVEHGLRGTTGDVHATFRRVGNDIDVEFRHLGAPFRDGRNRDEPLQEGGRGIDLIEALTDDIVYEELDLGGQRVYLRKRLE